MDKATGAVIGAFASLMVVRVLVHGTSEVTAPIYAILGFVGALTVYFVKKGYDEGGERKRISENLHAELEDTIDALDFKRHEGDVTGLKGDGGMFPFMNRMFNHDVYGSMIHSGKIGILKSDMQQSLQDVFQTIKDHNRRIENIGSVEDGSREGEDITAKVRKYYKMLHDYEKELPEEIRKLQKKLKSEFDF